ncbi:hypothetical protein Q1695_015526 [Nippostrongylus brasiliensis]|nr:hypothetical protein Q1695_015526 [Nippostrongylus brasiliensis]
MASVADAGTIRRNVECDEHGLGAATSNTTSLQETKGKTETIRKTDTNELIIGAKVDRRNFGGVGLLINSTVHHLVDSYKVIAPRMTFLRLEAKNQGNISIINGCAPTSAATDEEKEELYKLLERTVDDEKSYYKVVLGDFNATVGALQTRSLRSESGNVSSNG